MLTLQLAAAAAATLAPLSLSLTLFLFTVQYMYTITVLADDILPFLFFISIFFATFTGHSSSPVMDEEEEGLK